jgi:hypothetical protein
MKDINPRADIAFKKIFGVEEPTFCTSNIENFMFDKLENFFGEKGLFRNMG